MLQKSCRGANACVILQSKKEEGHNEDEQSPDLSLLSLEKQPFYQRLLQRDNSWRVSSRRRLTPSVVPFLWESSPGLPKPTWLNLNSDDDDHEYTPNYCTSSPLAPPPIMHNPPLHHNFSCNKPTSTAHHHSSLASLFKTAFHRSRPCTASPSSSPMLLMASSNSLPAASIVSRDEFSPRSPLDILQGQLGSNSSSDSEHYQVPGSATKLREVQPRGTNIQSQYSLTYKPTPPLSSRMNKTLIPLKIKGCCCFHISKCEL